MDYFPLIFAISKLIFLCHVNESQIVKFQNSGSSTCGYSRNASNTSKNSKNHPQLVNFPQLKIRILIELLKEIKERGQPNLYKKD